MNPEQAGRDAAAVTIQRYWAKNSGAFEAPVDVHQIAWNMDIPRNTYPKSTDTTSRWLTVQRIAIHILGEHHPGTDAFCKELLAPAAFVNKLHGKGLTVIELARRFSTSEQVITDHVR